MLQKMTIKSKLLVLTGSSLVVLATILATVAIIKSKDALVENSYNNLTSARQSKKQQIENFFNERVGDIQVLARGKDIQNLASSLYGVIDTLDFNTNKALPVKNQRYQKAMQKHESFFQGYMKDYGYYDIFLIDAKHGHVLYSAAKESDFGANLQTQSLKNSGLAKAYQNALRLKRPSFVDMEPYAPSNGAPAMFLSTPVYTQDSLQSVLVFQISDRAINNIMQFRTGYGQTQEDYLIGQDKLMRSDSYLDPKGHSLQASFANPSKGSVNTKAATEALNGKSDTKIIIDYNGNPVLSSYAPLQIGQDLQWAILSEIDEAEVMEVPQNIQFNIILISLVLLGVILGISVAMINKLVVKRLVHFQKGLLGFFDYVNRKANDVQELENDSFDEIGIMAQAVNENIHKTKKSLDEDRKVIEDTIAVLAEFEQGDLCQRVNTNTSNPALQELTSLMNQMGSNIESNIDGVLQVLEEYSNYNYMNKVDTNSIKEHLLRLANGVNSLGEAITGMLVDNKQNGLTLDESSNTLVDNVNTLNKNSNEAAAALEETAAALEEVTSNVSSTNENVVKMANYASDVTDAVSSGQKLANDTTSAMENINAEVVSISEAITIIDQISFQTNILSLNAAVEAATAGEAGKGFAVVAGEVRNLASRSAEAAKEIKTLVQSASQKADDGKDIADNMIQGYTGLNESISQTIELIQDVQNASKEQEAGIIQINDAITSLDRQTQENANIASQTHLVAMQTDEIAKMVVQSANEKEFHGKNEVKARSTKNNELPTPKSQAPTKAPTLAKPQSKSNHLNTDDQWESF